jgi:ATP-dependent DNA helicase RecG
MTEQCIEAGLPAPLYSYKSSGIWVEFRKDIYNKEHLKDFGLNERQINAVLYAKDNESITNSEYQEINDIGRTTATEDLKFLVGKGLFEQIGTVGKGTKYKLKSQLPVN